MFLGLNITKNSYALFSASIKGEKTIEVEVTTCRRSYFASDTSGANKPVLDTNMIPVYYDECEEVWKKADITNESRSKRWYNYDEKVWANSVTVTSENREKYKEAKLGTEIAMDDILTMQVWIPRYKYKVWNYNSDGTVTSKPQEIEIVFENGTERTGEIKCTDTISGTNGNPSETCKIGSTTCTDSTCNNKYYTHPAFIFGEEELPGFWVGKFEVSSNIECTVGANSTLGSGCNLSTIRPLVKPNVISWRGAQIGTFSTNIMKMNDANNIYGFSSSTDTHMIKNMEWGAVSYLSHSKYGTCTDGTCHEIGINNNSNYITGCGAEAGSVGSATCNSYETELGMYASTTGNIYGVYDMSGGAQDYVMANLISPDGITMMSGYGITTNSGYTGIVYSLGAYSEYIGIYNYPASKYYDKYSFGNGQTGRGRSKIGDGVREVYNETNYGWYGDRSYFVNSPYPWLYRGGSYNVLDDVGIFNSYSMYGNGYEYYTSRLIITP